MENGDGRAGNDHGGLAGPTGESTQALLAKASEGDTIARDTLLGRCLPRLRRWARGRLPAFARERMVTDDLVQETLLRVFQRLPDFEVRHEGAFHAYLRQALLNRIRDEVRRAARRPLPTELSELQPDDATSPLEQAVGREALDRYEAGLAKLRAVDREALVGRIELGYSYDELALVLGKPTANAARVAVTRALARLVEVMRHDA